jgi:hypothetical protein
MHFVHVPLTLISTSVQIVELSISMPHAIEFPAFISCPLLEYLFDVLHARRSCYDTQIAVVSPI